MAPAFTKADPVIVSGAVNAVAPTEPFPVTKTPPLPFVSLSAAIVSPPVDVAVTGALMITSRVAVIVALPVMRGTLIIVSEERSIGGGGGGWTGGGGSGAVAAIITVRFAAALTTALRVVGPEILTVPFPKPKTRTG